MRSAWRSPWVQGSLLLLAVSLLLVGGYADIALRDFGYIVFIALGVLVLILAICELWFKRRDDLKATGLAARGWAWAGMAKGRLRSAARASKSRDRGAGQVGSA